MPFKDPAKNKAAKEAYSKKNALQEKARLKKHYINNQQKIKERSAEWYKANRARMAKWAKEYRAKNREKRLLVSAKYRAVKTGVAFNLTLEDVVIPEICPVLGIDLIAGVEKWAPSSPSLDRINHALGYIKGNVRVISWRANNLKRDGTAEEFERIAAYMRGEL